MTTTLAIANQKGGVAKTTTVASLGAALVELGHRVLLVDLDPQACLTFSLGIDPEDLDLSIHHVLTKGLDPTEVLIETAERIGRPRFAAPSLNYSTQNLRDLYLLDEARERNERALEIVGREGEYGMPGIQGQIDLMITDLMEGDVGRVEREWPRLWDEAINGTAWRPWLGGCRLAFVRAEWARQAEGSEATVTAAMDALERAERIRRRKYEAQARAILGEALVAVGRLDEGFTHLERAVADADELGTPSLKWKHRAVLGKARHATGGDDAADRAFREAADVIREYAATLSAEHAAGFLDAEPVREALNAAG